LKNTAIIVIWKGYVETVLQTARYAIIVISRYLNPTRENTKNKFPKTQEKLIRVMHKLENAILLEEKQILPTNFLLKASRLTPCEHI
jgi:phage gp37-like protein